MSEDYTWMDYITPINTTNEQQPDSSYLASPQHAPSAVLPVQFSLNLAGIGNDIESPLLGPRQLMSSSK